MDQITVFLNGAWVPNSELHISVDDAGFLLGATVTERLRTFGGQVFRLDEHLERLRNSLKIVGLDSDAICNQVAAAVPEFLRRNQALIDAGDDWSIIAFATPGVAGSGRPTVCVHGYPLPFKSWASKYRNRRAGDREPNPTAAAQLRAARAQMPQPHALLSGRSRGGAEAARSRGDFVGSGWLRRRSHDCERGRFSRRRRLHFAAARQHSGRRQSRRRPRIIGAESTCPFVTRRLTVDELCSADEALLTSTSICALPIVECNGHPIADGKPGPTYRRLLSAWNDLAGLNIADQARRYAGRH